jgi:hypothetical protein
VTSRRNIPADSIVIVARHGNLKSHLQQVARMSVARREVGQSSYNLIENMFHYHNTSVTAQYNPRGSISLFNATNVSTPTFIHYTDTLLCKTGMRRTGTLVLARVTTLNSGNSTDFAGSYQQTDPCISERHVSLRRLGQSNINLYTRKKFLQFSSEIVDITNIY